MGWSFGLRSSLRIATIALPLAACNMPHAAADAPPETPEQFAAEHPTTPETTPEPSDQVLATPQRKDTHFAHETDQEYQKGLARMMVAAPAAGIRTVTSFYNVGYLAGMQEAAEYQDVLDGGVKETACLVGFRLVMAYFENAPAVPTIEETCAKLGHLESKSTPQGPRFAETQLFAAKTAAEGAADLGGVGPMHIQLLTRVNAVGYHMGFAHEWESRDHRSKAKEIAQAQCERAYRYGVEHGWFRRDVPAAAADAVTQGCAAEGDRHASKTGEDQRCLLNGVSDYDVVASGCQTGPSPSGH